MMTTPSRQPRTGTLSALPPQDTALLVVCAVAFTIPLTIAPWASDAFELPKVVVLRALVLVLVALLGARALSSGRAWATPVRGWLRHPLVAAVLAFALVLTASTFLSTDRRVSLWGSYERQQGLLTVIQNLPLCRKRHLASGSCFTENCPVAQDLHPLHRRTPRNSR
jgi:hypothetical protein